MRSICLPLAIIPLLILAGCETHEFDLTRPPDLAGHIGRKSDMVVQRDPLEYRFIAYEGRLIARIFNNGDVNVELLGPQSSIVDPHGQSHPLRGQSIAAHSFIKLILPPIRPQHDREGPSIGIGFGVIGRAANDGEPIYLDLADDDALYWDWDDESEIRLSLAYQRGDSRFTHEFVFHRVKS